MIFNNLKIFLKSIFDSSDNAIFKIIDVLHSQISNLISIKYQAVGKSSVSTEPVKDIYRDLAFIQGFSKKDSSLILEAYQLQNNSPDFFLISVIFNDYDPIFLIKDRNSEEQFNFSSNFINSNRELLKLFSITDAYTIFNVLSDRLLAKEKEEINVLKKQIKKNNLRIVSF